MEPPTTAAPTTEPDPRAAELAAVTAAVAEVLATSVTVEEVPSNLTPALRGAHGNAATPFRDGCFTDFESTEVQPCVYGAATPTGHAVLFGDSHATAWFPALEPVALERGWRLDVLTKATCPPLTSPVHSPNFGRPYRECDEWRLEVLERVAVERPAVVILAANRNYGERYGLPRYGPEWIGGLSEMVTHLRGLGAQVVVLGPVPLPVQDVPECLSANLSAASTCAPHADNDFELAAASGVPLERQAVEAAGGHYVDVRPWFCTPAACAVIVGNLLVYRDQNHITTDFAAWLAPVLGATLDALLSPR